jgi:hypothetical protein
LQGQQGLSRDKECEKYGSAVSHKALSEEHVELVSLNKLSALNFLLCVRAHF